MEFSYLVKIRASVGDRFQVSWIPSDFFGRNRYDADHAMTATVLTSRMTHTYTEVHFGEARIKVFAVSGELYGLISNAECIRNLSQALHNNRGLLCLRTKYKTTGKQVHLDDIFVMLTIKIFRSRSLLSTVST